VVPGGSAARIDAADLRALASASKAVLGSVARDARDRLADRRQERKTEHAQTPRRRRFKRRWIVVPAVTALLLLVLILAGVALAWAQIFGHL
jgi:Flp pilus assembly protein TadB